MSNISYKVANTNSDDKNKKDNSTNYDNTNNRLSNISYKAGNTNSEEKNKKSSNNNYDNTISKSTNTNYKVINTNSDDKNNKTEYSNYKTINVNYDNTNTKANNTNFKTISSNYDNTNSKNNNINNDNSNNKANNTNYKLISKNLDNSNNQVINTIYDSKNKNNNNTNYKVISSNFDNISTNYKNNNTGYNNNSTNKNLSNTNCKTINANSYNANYKDSNVGYKVYKNNDNNYNNSAIYNITNTNNNLSYNNTDYNNLKSMNNNNKINIQVFRNNTEDSIMRQKPKYQNYHLKYSTSYSMLGKGSSRSINNYKYELIEAIPVKLCNEYSSKVRNYSHPKPQYVEPYLNPELIVSEISLENSNNGLKKSNIDFARDNYQYLNKKTTESFRDFDNLEEYEEHGNFINDLQKDELYRNVELMYSDLSLEQSRLKSKSQNKNGKKYVRPFTNVELKNKKEINGISLVRKQNNGVNNHKLTTSYGPGANSKA